MDTSRGTPLAKIEVMSARLLADREVIPQAIKLNPAFFKMVYSDLLNAKKTREERAGGAFTLSTTIWRTRAPSCSRRSSTICARSGEARSRPRLRTTSSGISASTG